MRSFLILLIVAALSSCGQAGEKQAQPVKSVAAPQTEVNVYPVKDGWGYRVAVNGKKFIQQDAMPVIHGDRPFKTKADAEKVGNWVAERIRKNEKFSLTLPILQDLVSSENMK